MKKKILATTLTAGIATALVATNGVVSTFAFSGNNVQKVEVTSKKAEVTIKKVEVIDNELKKTVIHQEVDPSIKNLVEIADFSNYSITKKTNQDMNYLEAVKLAKKAIEEKFKTSLDGSHANTGYTDRIDKEGTFYFITFENRREESGNPENEAYCAFVNSKTGEVDQMKDSKAEMKKWKEDHQNAKTKK